MGKSNCDLAHHIPLSKQTLFFPTTPSASPRQGTWLTRPHPRPQIEGTLYRVPVQQMELSRTGLMSVISTTLCQHLKAHFSVRLLATASVFRNLNTSYWSNPTNDQPSWPWRTILLCAARMLLHHGWKCSPENFVYKFHLWSLLNILHIRSDA